MRTPEHVHSIFQKKKSCVLYMQFATYHVNLEIQTLLAILIVKEITFCHLGLGGLHVHSNHSESTASVETATISHFQPTVCYS